MWGEDVGGCIGYGESGLNRIYNILKWMYWMINVMMKVVFCVVGLVYMVIIMGLG